MEALEFIKCLNHVKDNVCDQMVKPVTDAQYDDLVIIQKQINKLIVKYRKDG